MKHRILVSALALAVSLAFAPAALAKDIVVHAGKLLDGVSKTPQTNVSILIHDDRITDIRSGFVFAERL